MMCLGLGQRLLHHQAGCDGRGPNLQPTPQHPAPTHALQWRATWLIARLNGDGLTLEAGQECVVLLPEDGIVPLKCVEAGENVTESLVSISHVMLLRL
jgi:hypothetical protein